MSLTTRDIAWLAGLLEGEGWFRFNSRAPHVAVAMTDRDIIERAARMLGVSVRPKKAGLGCKPQWIAACVGVKAIGWMFTLYPLLGDRRRAKIRSVVKLWRETRPHNKHRTHCPSGHPYSAANTMRDPTRPARRCRLCSYARSREWAARNPARMRVAQARYRARLKEAS